MDSEIKALLNKNTMSDLKRFIRQRQNLNAANVYLKYFFHCVQTAGLLTTSIAQSYGGYWSQFARNLDTYLRTNQQLYF